MSRGFEDFSVGDRFESPPYLVTESAMLEFARQFDPQPFHLDPQAARGSIFGGLIASGWHTAAITMRLIVDSRLDVEGGIVGLGVENMSFPKAVRAGDSLHAVTEILGVRASRSRPDQGLMTVSVSTINQDGDVVLTLQSTVLVRRRSPGGEAPVGA